MPTDTGRPIPANVNSHREVNYLVLIIDDHEMFSTLLTIALREQGMQTHAVTIWRLDAILDQATTLAPGLAVLELDLGSDPEAPTRRSRSCRQATVPRLDGARGQRHP
jgi:ActR/RegA family two-component response regulator